LFGVSFDDIERLDLKLTRQLNYIESLGFNFGEGKSAKDFVYSANLNPKKYFAEINNRVNTIFLNAKEKGLKPVFCTITAPSEYHKINQDGSFVVDPNETAKKISSIFDYFKTNLYIFRKMKREINYDITYFRVYEPHKSGVPHCHIMMFLPVEYILRVKKAFYHYFSTRLGSNLKALDFRYTWHNQGGGAVGYIMKYILKSFKNEDKPTKSNFAVYWYLKHKIRRFLSSRTLVPLSIYRKVRYYFKNQSKNDLKLVTQLYQNGQLFYLFNKDDIFYRYFDSETGELEEIRIYATSAEVLLNRRKTEQKPIKLCYKKAAKRVVFSIDGKSFINKGGMLKPLVSSPYIPSKMSDFSLYSYFLRLDKYEIDFDIKHYGLVKNELIRRGLLDGFITPLSLYNTNIA